MRKLPILAALLAVVGGGSFLFLRSGESAPARHPDVLLITLDTFRPDFVGPGHGTPALDAFLESGAVVPHARTAIPLTLPAHASLFTGLLPVHTGLHDNVAAPIPPRHRRKYVMLAEQFRDAGYQTAGFAASGVLAKSTGIGAGFDRYDAPTIQEERPGEMDYIPAEERVKAPLAWLKARDKKKPYFLWVHFYDCHTPRFPFPGDARRPRTHADGSVRELYAGEVRRDDVAVEKMLQAVSPSTVVVIASDHGEGLFQHAEASHGILCYSTTIDEFLALRAPGFRGGRNVEGLRSICDVAPTLRELCDLPRLPGDGRPLSGPPHDVVVSESLYIWRLQGWGQCFSATDGRFTLVESGATMDLFDRSTDPGETRPLDPAGRPVYEKLDRALERLQATPIAPEDPSRMHGTVPAYAAPRRAVSAYLGRARNAKLPDPQQMMPVLTALSAFPTAIQNAAASQDVVALQSAVVRLTELAKQAPRSPMPHLYKAEAQSSLASLQADPAQLRAAAHSLRGAMERDLLTPIVVAQGLEFAVAGKDREDAAAILHLAVQGNFIPDDRAGKAIVAAIQAAGGEKAPPDLRRCAKALLERGFREQAGGESASDWKQWLQGVQ